MKAKCIRATSLIRQPSARGLRRRNGVTCLTSIFTDDGMAACDFLGTFTTRKMLGSLSEVSRDLTKVAKMMAEQENNLWKDSESVIPL